MTISQAPKATKPDPADTAFREKAREEVMDVARSAIGCNTNVIGGSGCFGNWGTRARPCGPLGRER